VKPGALCVLALAVLLAGASSEAQGTQGTPTFRLGYSSETISDAGAEAEVVTRALVGRIALRTGVLRPETRSFSDLKTLEAAIKSGQLDVVIVTGDEYVRLEGETKLEPALSAVRGGMDFLDLGVVVRRGSGISSLRDLRGRAVLNSKDQSRVLQTVWLDTELMSLGLESASMFSSFKESRNPSHAIMAVFFGQVDACVVALPTFKIAAELNPQIAEQLKVIVASPPFPRGVIAFSAGYDKASRDNAYETMLELNEDPEGRQILGAFKQDRMTPLRVALLENSRRLRAEHTRLTAARPRNGAFPGEPRK